MKSHIDETSKNSSKRRAKRGGVSAWLDERRVKSTVRRWRRRQRSDARRSKAWQALRQMPHAGVIGDALYMVGFWVEYAAVCTGRTLIRTATAVLSHVGALLFLILRPLGVGLVTFLEDLLQPFVRLYSGVRHIRALPEQHPEETSRQLRAEKFRYFTRGAKLYLPLVWNVFTYVLPAAALVALVLVVRSQLNETYRLEVRVNGEMVGFVESEQVFDNARDDVQSRINSALEAMQAAGVEVEDAQWDITPTYTLAASDEVMTESEVADAILRASSDEIGDGTAVYIDGELRFVTTEGDHLRAYLDAIKQPYEDAFDANRRVSFVHDIQLVDGVYFLSSIVPYDTVISTLNQQTPGASYTVPEEGQTAQEAADAAGVSFSTLQALNPDLQSAEEELTGGSTLVTANPTAELLQVKVVERQSIIEDVQYETEEFDSDEYDFGDRVVVQEGQLGQQEVVSDVTTIGGQVTDVTIVEINVIQQPVNERVAVGTRLASGMVAQVGSGTFYWPVPQYRYVSRWMSAGHKGCDIIAPAGTPIIASDNGVVQAAGWNNGGYGNYVVIDHGNGWRTLYGHMLQVAVQSGQAVEAGQVIGYVGNTGDSYGNHCHFEMYYNNSLVSAREFFPNM
ncbi:MAG TPA: peptidoglycan DD-metalloendopeptidase family protein [Candidatus Gemmiger faecigallinarum]|nr:peptidoglycan DD-metalloendopeptidase family protein [Candidatus Gemmiger faecigallinarum]